MDHRRLHLLEKAQVQAAAAAGIAIVYFAFWAVVRPSGPEDPVLYAATAGFGSAALFAGMVLLLAALCALATVHARPEGALMAALLGAGGISLRSDQLRGMLWHWQDRLPSLFLVMAAEVLLMAAVLLAAALVVDAIRRLIARAKPGWVWKSPHADEDSDAPGRGRAGYTLMSFLRPRPGGAGKPRAGGSMRFAGEAKRFGGCLALSGVIAAVLVLLLLRSSDRGQILFALLAACLIGSLIAHQTFPTHHSVALWIMPLILALGFYALSAATAMRGPGAWMHLPHYARALPVDWLTAGCGGALIGFWLSERICELRHLEQQEEKHGEAAA